MLPLWDPSPVEVGAVGYLLRPQGRFATLFNALTPETADHAGIRSPRSRIRINAGWDTPTG